jgi:hypothetical protein
MPPLALGFAAALGLTFVAGLAILFAVVFLWVCMLFLATISVVITLFYRPFWDKYWVPFVNYLQFPRKSST